MKLQQWFWLVIEDYGISGTSNILPVDEEWRSEEIRTHHQPPADI